MTRQTDNLEELWHQFCVNTSARRARDEMRAQAENGGAWDLKLLLRYHENEDIDRDDEIAARDSFDYLLGFFGCVEIAALVGFVPNQLPQEFRRDAILTLGNPHVRRYYREFYPLLLPDMLFARICGVRAPMEGTGSQLQPLFLEFLHVSSILEDDHSVSMLLWFLDDGSDDDYDWQDLLEILSKPKQLIEALQSSPRRRNSAQEAVVGLQKFLSFCVAFDDLLSRSQDFPLFQAAMWHYHAYWFRIVKGGVRVSLEHAFGRFERWFSEPAAKQLSKERSAALKAEAANSLRQIREVVARLTGTQYGKVLTRSRLSIRRDSVEAKLIIGDLSGYAVDIGAALFEPPSAESYPYEAAAAETDLAFNPVLLKKVGELELSLRSLNCLNSDNIVYVGDLIQRTEAEMLRTPNFNRRSLNEIKTVLAEMGLQLGTEVPGWPPEDIEHLVERYEDEV